MINKLVKPVVILFVTLAIVANAYFYLTKNDVPNTPTLTPAQKELIKIGAKCLDFGERSVANDVPIIEFQMVVRLAKKTTTISNCMRDNGYRQNTKWLEYAQPAAKLLADKSKSEVSGSKVSESEALTNLGRTDMQIFEPNNRPSYWTK